MRQLSYPKPSPDSVVPDDSKCPVCNYFDITHPDVVRVLTARDPSKRTWHQYQCKCPLKQRQEESRDELRRQQANVPHPKQPRTFANWQHNPETRAAFDLSYQFAQGKGPHVLVLTGAFGLGKSHLVEAIIRCTLDENRSARYELTSSFLDRLRHCYDDDSEQDLWDLSAWYQRIHLLALDDMGVEKPTEWGREKLTMVVDERLREGRRLVIVTNHDKNGMAASVGPRMASRLFPEHSDDEVSVAYLAGEDHR